jgi:catechol 2,3-dioxygenase-like lactoylglutathione lyase family enzyme
MITGGHVMLYSTDADADRAFLRDVLALPNVDVGGGWLIFRLPSAEIATHPSDENKHALYLICDSVDATVVHIRASGVACSDPFEASWGRATSVTLPGGGMLGIYESRHAHP